jgi:hypothetical protein
MRFFQKERRSSSRSYTILEGTLKYAGRFVPVDITSLSESGAMVHAPLLPDYADTTSLVISLPDGRKIMVSGRVRRFTPGDRHLPGGFAIEFTRFYSSAGQQALRENLAA